jgi:signal transduction histidine kinase
MRKYALFTVLSWVFTFHFTIYGQYKIIDSLHNELSKTENINKIADLHLQLYKKQMRTNIDSASLNLQKAINLTKKKVNDSVKAKTLVYRIENLLHSDKYDSVFFYADKAIAMKGSIKPNLMIDIYSMLGTTFYYKSEYAKAIETHLKAEKLSDENEIEEGKARVYNNIGIAYIKLKNWRKAEEYMDKSLKICRQFNIIRGISYTLGNLGIIYKNLNKPDKAIAAYLESNKICEKLNDKRAVARNYENIGALYEFKKDFNKALQYYLNSLKMSESMEDKSTMASALHNIGNIYSKQGKFLSSGKNFQKSLAIAMSLKNKDVIRDNYLGLSIMYEGKGDINRALMNRKFYENWKDSIVNESHLRAVSQLEIKYQTEKKEKDILALSAVKLKNEAVLEKQQSRIKNLSFSLLGLTLLFGLASVLFKQYTSNKKQIALISAIADTQIEERKRIAQDLHDGVGGSLALAKNKLESLLASEKEKSKKITAFLETLTQTSNQIRQISHNMMPGELVKFGLVSAVQTTLEQLDDNNLKAHLYTHGLDKRIDQTKEIHTFRIIQEIVQNVLKHAKASTLNIHLNKYAKKLSLLIEDDGVGFAYNVSSTEGIGIKNIKNRVHYLNGKLKIDSNKGKGTTFNIEIPLV